MAEIIEKIFELLFINLEIIIFISFVYKKMTYQLIFLFIIFLFIK